MKPLPNHPTSFGHAPIIGQQKQQIQNAVQAAVNQLSIQLYAQHASLDLEPEQLRQLAQKAQKTALAYFQGIGLLTEQKKETP